MNFQERHKVIKTGNFMSLPLNKKLNPRRNRREVILSKKGPLIGNS